MKTGSNGLLKASAIAIALLGSAAVISVTALPDAAYAKGGNGKGGGNGNSGGNGNGGGNGNDNGGNGKANGGGHGASKSEGKAATGKSNRKSGGSAGKRSKSAKEKKFSLKQLLGGKKSKITISKTKTSKTARKTVKTHQVKTSVRPEKRQTGNKMATLLGVHPSELGALNAANASETALNNAAPNSRVGRIAKYRDTVLAGDDLRAALQEKQDLLDGMTPPDRPLSEIEDDLDVAQTDVQEKQDRVTELEEALEAVGGTDPDIEAALEDANSELQEAIDTVDNLNAEKQAAVDYEEAVQEVEDLSEAVEKQAQTEREALEAAANKPVTDEVEAAVKSLLGLDG